MKFSEVLAISGQSGLYKYLAHGKCGIIVESLADGRRFSVSATSQVSALRDIAIYTEVEDMPLAEVFQTLSDQLEGKPAISAKEKPEALAKVLATYLPTYDRQRVRSSDIKKLFTWYNLLQSAGMTQFIEEETEEEAAQEEEK